MRSIILFYLFFFLLSACRSTNTSESSILLDSTSTIKFANYSGSVVCEPGSVVVASTVEEIQNTVRAARQQNKDIRVVSLAAPRSYSPVICPEKGSVILNLQEFNQLLSVDPDKQTAVVQPGILINDLQDQLHEHGFTFLATPDYSGITIAGGMGTGAHHSSLNISTEVGEWVESVKLIDGHGNHRTLSGEEHDLGRVHLGLLGAIYELTIRIQPQHKLRYQFEKFSDDTLEQDVIQLVRRHDYARVLWFPSQKTFILDSFDQVPMQTRGMSSNNTWSATPDISWLGDLPIATLNSSQLAQCKAEALRVKTFGGAFNVVDSNRNSPVGLSHQMIAGTCAPGKCPWDYGIKTRTVEVGFPLDRLEEWIGDVRSMLASRRACFPVLGIYLRFLPPSRAALGQAFGEETVVFEIHVPQTSSPSIEPSSDIYDEMVQMTLSKYNGRPHWGKNSLPYFLELGSSQYPKWGDFKQLRQQLDPDNVFKSPFWAQIKANAEAPHSPGCAVSKACICQTDSDCGSGARCESGVFFTEARVCRR